MVCIVLMVERIFFGGGGVNFDSVGVCFSQTHNLASLSCKKRISFLLSIALCSCRICRSSPFMLVGRNLPSSDLVLLFRFSCISAVEHQNK